MTRTSCLVWRVIRTETILCPIVYHLTVAVCCCLIASRTCRKYEKWNNIETSMQEDINRPDIKEGKKLTRKVQTRAHLSGFMLPSEQLCQCDDKKWADSHPLMGHQGLCHQSDAPDITCHHGCSKDRTCQVFPRPWFSVRTHTSLLPDCDRWILLSVWVLTTYLSSAMFLIAKKCAQTCLTMLSAAAKGLHWTSSVW